jgi:hypothetical protein
MPNHVFDANHYQSKSAMILVNASHWVADVVEDLHSHKTLQQQVAYLRSLDRHILQDMGIDIEALFNLHPHISQADGPEDNQN